MENDNLRLNTDRHLSWFTLLKRNIKYLKPQIFKFILAFIIIIINVLIDIAIPLFITNVVKELSKVSPDYKMILFYSLAHLGLGLFNQGLLFLEAMILQHAGQEIVYHLRMQVFSHIENLSQNQLNDMPVGSLVTRVASYTASMSDLFTNVVVNLLRNILTVIGVYVIMVVIAIQNDALVLALVLLGFAVIVFISSFIFGGVVGKIFRKERKLVSDMNTFLNENLSGIKVIQLFNQEKRKEEEFLVKNEELRKARFNITLAFGIYRPFISFLYIFAEAMIFYFGVTSGLPAESIMAFYLYLSKFFNPIQNLADQLNEIQRSFTASERIFNLLDVEPEVIDDADSVEIDHFEGRIEFKNVWFAYVGENWILKDVSFVIEPKQTVAFVGATGAGKTTILSLIVRNFDIQKGQILIDGIDIKKIKITSLRKAIGQMLQDVFLFTGSIRSNITLHDDEIPEEEVLEAVKYVNADSFINKLENGLDSQVIERGENFSQGQRQLLSFARTVIHKPQILILDEATANIDTETEVLIQDSLEKIKNIGTMLVVAHRLSTIQHSDQIIVLQNGEIVEHGTHQELLKNRGYYYKLYELQFNNQD